MSISAELEVIDVVCRGRLDPNSLPDPAARGVKDVGWVQCLLPDWDLPVAGISGIVCENNSAKVSNFQ